MSNILYTPGMSLEALEKQAILYAYGFYKFNKTATASSLGIAIRTLDNKLSKYLEEEQKEYERTEQERIRREEFERRARGAPQETGFYHPPALQPHAGVRMESHSETTPQPAMSLSERQKVQTVLPGPSSKSDSRKSG